MVFSQIDGIGAVRADRRVHSAAMAVVIVERLVRIISTTVEAGSSSTRKAPKQDAPPGINLVSATIGRESIMI